jgi:hypothetical protein
MPCNDQQNEPTVLSLANPKWLQQVWNHIQLLPLLHLASWLHEMPE